MKGSRFSSLVFVCVLSVSSPALAQSPQSSASNVTFVRTATVTGGEVDSFTEDGFVAPSPNVDSNFPKPLLSGTIAPARVPAAHVPTASGTPIVSGTFFSFLGLTHRNQRRAGTGSYTNTQFSIEPPDQGLAVGNGLVLEVVNNVMAVYSASSGASVAGPEPMNQFFGLAPAIRRTAPPVFGPFLSDPKAYFDADTGHFFLTEVEIDRNPATGAFGPGSSIFIAVSQTNDPTGSWNIFQLDVTTDGDSIFGSCPCFGDQPLIGADNFGFYINTNAFSLSTLRFRGTQLYAISKHALATGTPPSVTAVRFHNLILDSTFPFFSIQPATAPPGGSFETRNGGTEYFVSSLDFFGTLADQLAVWAVTNTSSLDTAPDLHLSRRIITTEVYGQPPSAEQKPGPTPLLDDLAATGFPPGLFQNHLELVASNDDRMQQVVFAAGKLWTGLNTVVETPEGPVRTGPAWFILSPSVSGNGASTQAGATVVNQGYVALDSPSQNSILYPSIGVNSSGKAVIGFSVVGQDHFPSAAYATLDVTSGAGPIVVSGPGFSPDDGFSGYFPFGFRVGRWGDYSAAVADEDGHIWLANEMIPNAPRTLLANWGTFIVRVSP